MDVIDQLKIVKKVVMYKIDRRGGGTGGPKNRILGIYHFLYLIPLLGLSSLKRYPLHPTKRFFKLNFSK